MEMHTIPGLNIVKDELDRLDKSIHQELKRTNELVRVTKRLRADEDYFSCQLEVLVEHIVSLTCQKSDWQVLHEARQANDKAAQDQQERFKARVRRVESKELLQTERRAARLQLQDSVEDFVATSDKLATNFNQAVLTQQAKLHQSEETKCRASGSSLLAELAKQEGQAETLAIKLQLAKADVEKLINRLAELHKAAANEEERCNGLARQAEAETSQAGMLAALRLELSALEREENDCQACIFASEVERSKAQEELLAIEYDVKVKEYEVEQWERIEQALTAPRQQESTSTPQAEGSKRGPAQQADLLFPGSGTHSLRKGAQCARVEASVPTSGTGSDAQHDAEGQVVEVVSVVPVQRHIHGCGVGAPFIPVEGRLTCIHESVSVTRQDTRGSTGQQTNRREDKQARRQTGTLTNTWTTGSGHRVASEQPCTTCRQGGQTNPAACKGGPLFPLSQQSCLQKTVPHALQGPHAEGPQSSEVAPSFEHPKMISTTLDLIAPRSMAPFHVGLGRPQSPVQLMGNSQWYGAPGQPQPALAGICAGSMMTAPVIAGACSSMAAAQGACNPLSTADRPGTMASTLPLQSMLHGAAARAPMLEVDSWARAASHQPQSLAPVLAAGHARGKSHDVRQPGQDSLLHVRPSKGSESIAATHVDTGRPGIGSGEAGQHYTLATAAILQERGGRGATPLHQGSRPSAATDSNAMARMLLINGRGRGRRPAKRALKTLYPEAPQSVHDPLDKMMKKACAKSQGALEPELDIFGGRRH